MAKTSDSDSGQRLYLLRLELLKLQTHLKTCNGRLAVLVEGRDAAGKDGLIRTIGRHVSPRVFRVVALGKPTEEERSAWYFKRYVAQLPNAGEAVLFNRSWYNRGVVEAVMGFCTREECTRFLKEAPLFERLIGGDGMTLVKLWLEVSKAEQARRLAARRNDPLKRWKVSAVDEAAQERWDDFTAARDRMLKATDHPKGRWFVIDADRKHTARLTAIAHILAAMPYPGRDDRLIAETLQGR